MTETLRQLSEAGVAIWLDDLSRERLVTGNLEALVRDKSVVGVTSNPTIFQKAISSSETYDPHVHDLAVRRVTVEEALRMVTTFDVRWACDVLRPCHDLTGLDGRVSIAEARQLWWLVDRPNLFIKIPATEAGLPAISACLAEGISVNVTLIFSLQRYEQVMDAYLEGLERAHRAGLPVHNIESVASFFVSRVDTEVDKRLDKIGSEEAKRLRGQAAIANARLAYQRYERVFGGERWKALEALGARPQRPLWASTGVKDPAYDDTRYVLDLVAPGIVNTMPEATLEAVADHGVFRGDAIHGRYEEAQKVLDDLAALGVDYDDVVQVLEDEGVEKFETSWNELLSSVKGELERLAEKRS
jgi:transaldolase